MTTTTRTDAEILRAAADRIERDGWHQGNLFSWDRIPEGARADLLYGELIATYNPPCCIYGALLGEDPEDTRAWELARDAIGTGEVGRWNDAPGRTQEEVVAALRAAADTADEEV